MPQAAPNPRISIVVPVLNEAATVERLLDQLAPFRTANDEILLVDGGSQDDTVRIAARAADQILHAPRGRASQMNCGGHAARGELLWFVHADTQFGEQVRTALLAVLERGDAWGRFDITIGDPARSFRLIERAVNWRSRLTGIATGDQGIFVRRELFLQVGGFPDLALMEDIELSARLRRISQPKCLELRLTTSARRWQKHGVLRTVVLMWSLRLAWFCGVRADTLARWYGYR